MLNTDRRSAWSQWLRQIVLQLDCHLQRSMLTPGLVLAAVARCFRIIGLDTYNTRRVPLYTRRAAVPREQVHILAADACAMSRQRLLRPVCTALPALLHYPCLNGTGSE
jgi:hypothetical protein